MEKPLQVGRYLCHRKLGTGGMAQIYQARITGARGFTKEVAIKLMHRHLADNPAVVDLFVNEARITGQLDHPNIVTVFELGTHDGLLYLVMELVDGLDLSQLLGRLAEAEQSVDWDVALAIALEVTRALQFLHACVLGRAGRVAPVVHRDLSPGNIMICRAGGVKLLDFGVAKILLGDEETHTIARGKWHYMSPEQVRGEPLDGRSDLFSLGAVLYELLTGRQAFRGQTVVESMRRVEQAELPEAPDLDPDLERLLQRLLARDPDERFVDASALSDAMAQMLVQRGKTTGEREVAALLHGVDDSPPGPATTVVDPPGADGFASDGFTDETTLPSAPSSPLAALELTPDAKPEPEATEGETAKALPTTQKREPAGDPVDDSDFADTTEALTATKRYHRSPPDTAEDAVNDEALTDPRIPRTTLPGRTYVPPLPPPQAPPPPPTPPQAPRPPPVAADAAPPPRPSPAEPVTDDVPGDDEPETVEEPRAVEGPDAPVADQLRARPSPADLAPRPKARRTWAGRNILVLILALSAMLVAVIAVVIAISQRKGQSRDPDPAPAQALKAPDAAITAPAQRDASAPRQVVDAAVARRRVEPRVEPPKRRPPPAPTASGSVALQGPVKAGQLDVVTTPSGARVWVAGRFRGKSPLRAVVPAGRQVRVVLSMPGRGLYRTRLWMPSAVGRRLKILMPYLRKRFHVARPGRTALKVECQTSGIHRVLIDGLDSGYDCPTPALEVLPIRHLVALYLVDRGKTVWRKLRPRARKVTTVTWKH